MPQLNQLLATAVESQGTSLHTENFIEIFLPRTNSAERKNYSIKKSHVGQQQSVAGSDKQRMQYIHRNCKWLW